MVDGNAAGQLDAARRFAALGLDLHAAEAATVAAEAYRRAGRPVSAREPAALAAKHAAACPGVATPALQMTVPNVPLTPREHEMAMLAARGMSNRQIADELFVSVRTVESCVLRACRKLGVESRRALAELLVH